MPVIDAIEEMAERRGESKSKALAIPVWETRLMIKMKLTEEEYTKIPKIERARKISGMLLPDWLQALEYDEEAQRIKK